MEENQRRNQLREARVKLERTRKNLNKVAKEEKMLLKSKYRMSEVEQMEKLQQNNRLNYGFRFWATYKGHEQQEINGILWNPNSRAFVTWNEKFVHVWSPNTAQKLYFVDFHTETKSHLISDMTYSVKNFLYIIVSTDFKAHIFNEALILVKTIRQPQKSSLLQHIEFIDVEDPVENSVESIQKREQQRNKDQQIASEKEKQKTNDGTLVACGIEGVFFYELTYHGATDKKQQSKLDPLGTRLKLNLKLKKKIGMMSWVKGFQIDREHKLLFCWSLKENKQKVSQEASVYNLRDGSHHFTYDNLFSEQENIITDMLYMPKYRYIVIATEMGELVVYKWDTTATLVTDFKGLNKSIKSLARHPFRLNQFITASLDSTIRIWCLEKFACQYVLKIPFEIKNIKMMDNLQFAAIERHQIQIGKLQDIVQMMHLAQTDVVCLGQCFKDMERQRENDPYAVFAAYRDNSIKLLAPKAQPDVMVKSTVFPPPQADDVRMVRFCTLLKQIIVYVWSGMLYFYRLEQGTSVMVREVKSQSLRDAQRQLLDQQLSCFEIGCIEPPRYDSRNAFMRSQLKRQGTFIEKKSTNCADRQKKPKLRRATRHDLTKADLEESNNSQTSDSTSMLETDSEELAMAPEDLWMMMGYNRGMVVIFNIHKFDIPQCRYDVCRAEITMIREVYPHRLHLFYDVTHLLTLAQLGEKGVKVMHQVNMFRHIFEILVFNSNIYLAFKSGEIDFWEVHNLQNNPFVQSAMMRKSTFEKLSTKMSVSELRTIRKNQIESDEFGFIRYDKSKKYDSEDTMKAVTQAPHDGMIAAADSTGLIKIWSSEKVLIREIQFPETINALRFINRKGDLMIGHSKTLSLVTADQILHRIQPQKNMERSDLMAISQRVDNELMYNYYVAEMGLKNQTGTTYKRLIDDVETLDLSDDSNEEAKEQLRGVIQFEEQVHSGKMKEQIFAEMQAARKQKQRDRLRKRKETYTVTLGRDLKIQIAVEKSQVLAQVALKDELERMEDELQKEKDEKSKKHHYSAEATMMSEIAEKYININTKKKKDHTKKSTKMSRYTASRVTTLPQATTDTVNVVDVDDQQPDNILFTCAADQQIEDSQDGIKQDLLPQPQKSIDVAQDLTSSFQLPDDFVYNAAVLAVPRQVIQQNYEKIGSLHPKRPNHSIRREMTERRISSNITQYNSAQASNQVSDIYVDASIKNESSMQSQFSRSNQQLWLQQQSDSSFQSCQNLGQGHHLQQTEEKKEAKRSGSQSLIEQQPRERQTSYIETQDMRRLRLKRERHQHLMSELKLRNKEKFNSNSNLRQNNVLTNASSSSSMLHIQSAHKQAVQRNQTLDAGKTTVPQNVKIDSLFQLSTMRQLEDTTQTDTSQRQLFTSNDISQVYQIPSQIPNQAILIRKSRSISQQGLNSANLPRINAHKQLQGREARNSFVMTNVPIRSKRASGSMIMLRNNAQDSTQTNEKEEKVKPKMGLRQTSKQLRSSTRQIYIEEMDSCNTSMMISRSNMYKKKQINTVVASGLRSNQDFDQTFDTQMAGTKSHFTEKKVDETLQFNDQNRGDYSLNKEQSDASLIEQVHQMETKPVYSSKADINLVVQERGDDEYGDSERITMTRNQTYDIISNASASQVVQTEKSEKQVYQ